MNRDHIETVKAEVDLKLTNKADLTTNDEQTFNSIINVPNFDPGYSNMSNVMNKKYIDIQDLKKADKTDVLLRNGDNKMLSNLDMNKNKIINCSDPTSDNDVVTKKYMESHVSTSHIQSSNRNNVFKYIMDDPAGELTEEDDIKLGNIITYQASPHQINKNVVDMKLLLDQLGKGYYSCRVGVNLFTLANSNYTLCFELLWSDGNIDPGTVYINGVSSIETIHNTAKKIFESQKYARLICQFDKSQNIGNNYLMIDIVMKMKSGALYTPNLQTYVVIYGVTGYQSDVQPNVYDLLYYVDNGKVVFNEEIDMNTHAIKGILEGTNDDQAVNYKQLNSFNDNLKTYLENKIKLLQPKSYYNTIFEYFYDLTEPSKFTMSDSFGAVVSGLNGNLVFNPTKLLADFEPNKGFMGGFGINFNNMTGANNWTIYMAFKNDYKSGDNKRIKINFVNGSSFDFPWLKVENNKLYLDYDLDVSYKQIRADYIGKYMNLWYTKIGNQFRIGICNNSISIDKIFSGYTLNASSLQISSGYYVQRIGFSKTAYPINDKVYHKIQFLDKTKGVFFE